jgi:type II secretion system protein H
VAAAPFPMKTLARRHWNENAFTLIELMVVCLLISIMLAVSVPSLRSALFTDQLKEATRQIIGTVQGLRAEAVRDQQPYLLCFDMEKKRIWYEKDLEDSDDQQEKRKTSIQVSAEVRIMDVWTKTDGRQSQGTATLWISRQGYMDMTVIHLTDESSTMSIFFSPFLGSIKVIDGYADLD